MDGIFFYLLDILHILMSTARAEKSQIYEHFFSVLISIKRMDTPSIYRSMMWEHIKSIDNMVSVNHSSKLCAKIYGEITSFSMRVGKLSYISVT